MPRSSRASSHRPSVATLLVSGALAAWAIGAGAAVAQPSPLGTPVETWIPNGSVSAQTLDGHVLYLGGEFDQVNLPTGTFASVDAPTGMTITAGAGLKVPVTAIAPDGNGGWYVSTLTGGFDTAVAHLDHVLPSGAVDPAWTRPDFGPSIVGTLVLEGGRLFVGGGFLTVNGLARAGIVALDPASGAVLPWDAALTFTLGSAWPSVTGIGAVAGRLYVSGLFSHVGGVARTNFAVLDPVSGAALPAVLTGAGAYLGTPVVAGGRVYVYGNCRSGVYELCAYDLDLVPLPGWTFPFSNVFLRAMTASDTAVFATREISDNPFTDQTVKLDPTTGVEMPWPALTTTRGVTALTAAGGRLYIAGRFTALGGQPRTRLAAVDATTGALDAWAPLVGGAVLAVSVQGSRVAFGGEFWGAGGIRKQNLVALDLRTGAPATPNAPDLPFAAAALQKIGDVMVVAGGENSVLASPQPNLLAFSTGTGVLLPWSLTTNGSVFALAADAQRLYFSGGFSAVGGMARSGLAAVELGSAMLSPWKAEATLPVRTLAIGHGALYAGGGFGGYPGGGGEPRNYVAAFDLGSGATLPFSPRPAMVFTSGLAFHQDRVLLVGGSADALEWVDRVTGAPVAPASAVSGYSYASAQHGGTVFVSGATAGNEAIVAIVDAPTGRIQVVPTPAAYGPIAVNDTYVAVGGRVFRRPGPGAPQRLTASVMDSAVQLAWQAGPPPATTAFVVEAGTSFGASDVGVFPVGPFTAASGQLSSGTYYTRVRGVGASGVGAASSEVILTVPATATAPNAPGTLSASVAGGVVTLQWHAASGNATSYVVEAGTTSGLSNLVTFATGHLDTSLVTPAPSGTYVVRVRAANAFGIGPATNEVTVVVP